ncbi:hypothetical protein DMUE_2247 [Dictyocoela muelleri]|nr:hypothetical protein DMUE_2247 [Dictyocoela muelleri]
MVNRKIIKVKGYIKVGNSELVQVCWDNRTVGWTRIQDVNCPSQLISFFRRVRTMCLPIQNKAIVKEKERSDISELRKLRKKSVGDGLDFKKREMVWDIKPKKYETFKNLDQKNDNFKIENRKRENLFINSKQFDETVKMRPFGKKDYYNNKNDFINNNNKNDFINNNKNDFINNNKNEFIKSNINQNVSSSNPNLKTRRYFDFEKTEISKKTISKEMFIVRSTSQVELFVDSNKICLFEYREMNQIDKLSAIKKFSASIFVDIADIKIFLLSALQNPKIWDYEIFNLDLLENNQEFKNLCSKMSNQKLVLVDTTNLTHYYVFVYGHYLKKYELLNNYNIIKIRKSYVDFCINEKIDKCLSNKINMWHRKDPLYSFNIENQVLFDLCSVESFNNYNFFLFTEAYDLFSDLLVRSLEYLGGKSVPITEEKISAVYVHSELIQYIYIMPRFHEILFSGSKFFKFDFCSDLPLVPIFPEGGVLTLDPKLLNDIDVPDLLNVLRTVDTENSKWLLKVPSKMISGLKELMDQHRGRLSYHGIEEIYKIAEKNVEGDIETDIEEYIKGMATKYFLTKRFFIVLSSGCKGDFYKTPVDVFKNYFKVRE